MRVSPIKSECFNNNSVIVFKVVVVIIKKNKGAIFVLVSNYVANVQAALNPD